MFFRLLMSIFLIPAILATGPGTGSARPAPMSAADHAGALAFIEETAGAMAEAEAALESLAAAGDAAAWRDGLGARLETLRRLMTEAAQRDRIGAKASAKNGNVAPERERAREVIARAGNMEERLQDLWTLWAQRARGDFSGCLAPQGYRPC
ncbi:hypothetical protein [Parvibaculum sp.]|jgi:hypothetical protein|uniref:hypothetical protein n=1 Tax=Parvibaculum sp. TaxID=2024848 RepID=UPI00348D7524